MITANVTLELTDEHKVYYLEQFLRDQYNVRDFRIVPNTENLYANDDTFKKLCKAVKDAQRIRDGYINQNNH